MADHLSTFMTRIVLALALFCSVTSVAAAPAYRRDIPRHRGCGTHISNERRLSSESRFRTHRVPAKNENATAVVDVYFHVVYANETAEAGYVPDEVIENQIKVLNEDYAATGLSFNLVNVERIEDEDLFLRVGPETDQEVTLKEGYRQGNASTLNIWTVGFMEGNGEGLLGYATFPSDYETKPTLDGVVLLHSTMPKNGQAPYNGGRTLTHEAGHWMGLYHTFEGGCQGNGDYVDDTPAVKDASYGCPKPKTTCPGSQPAFVTNFMDYTDDACMTAFSDGQSTRIRAQLRTFRNFDL